MTNTSRWAVVAQLLHRFMRHRFAFPRTLRMSVTALVIGVTISAHAADEAFVGVLALTADAEVAKQLELSDDVRQKLQDTIIARERLAVSLALRLRSVDAAERNAKLAEFAAESEKLGLALLTSEQRIKLQQIRIARAGMASLEEKTVSEQLKLSADQQQQVDRMLTERTAALSKTPSDRRRIVAAEFDRKIRALLLPGTTIGMGCLGGTCK